MAAFTIVLWITGGSCNRAAQNPKLDASAAATQRGGRTFLRFTLRNSTGEPVTIENKRLPWLHSSNTRLEWKSRPPSCGGKGQAESTWGEYSVGEVSIGAGGSLSGEVPLDLYFPELPQSLPGCEVILQWSYTSGGDGELVLPHQQ